MYPVLRALPECSRSRLQPHVNPGPSSGGAPHALADSAASHPVLLSPTLKSRVLAQPPQGLHSWSWLVTVDVERL